MINLKQITIAIGTLLILVSCNNEKSNFDASGSFETEETIISSEATGIIKLFNIEEGQLLKAGQIIGYIDSVQLFLKKKQLEAQISAILSKKPNASSQLGVLQENLKSAEKEEKRMANLVKGNAATKKQLDDIQSNIEIIKKQIIAQKSSLDITNIGIDNDINPLNIQLQQINDQLEKCKIINPINGIVLTKYANVNEMTISGKALYKIADLTNIILRAYISGNQLGQIKINQKVKVFTDDSNGGFKETYGTIFWINDKAEFTPKTIQTKDERANLVYAIKVKVINDGSFKIGMYGEIKFK